MRRLPRPLDSARPRRLEERDRKISGDAVPSGARPDCAVLMMIFQVLRYVGLLTIITTSRANVLKQRYPLHDDHSGVIPTVFLQSSGYCGEYDVFSQIRKL